MKAKCTILFLLFANFVFGQSGDSLSPEQKIFYKNLITAFRENSIERSKIDWKEFENKVLEKALVSKDSAIILALDLNNNPHTFYKDHGRKLYCSKRRNIHDPLMEFENCWDINLRNELPNIGYINVPRFAIDLNRLEASKQNAEKYIYQILDSIRTQDKPELKGWIIDLRTNSGGDMWPMLIALTPFYPEGILGYFIQDKKEVNWSKKYNEIFYDSYSQTNKYLAEKIDYKLKSHHPKIAVLIGGKTSSSGEAVAISTKSIPEAQLFGAKTSGYSTANMSIKIAVQEYLVLTEAVDADINKREYWDGIDPDFILNCNSAAENLKRWFDGNY
jgi:carboxyl-terminal processing protease